MRSSGRLTVNLVLFAGLGVMAALFAVVIISAYMGLVKVQKLQSELYNENYKNLTSLTKLRSNLNAEKLDMAAMLATSRSEWAAWRIDLASRVQEDSIVILRLKDGLAGDEKQTARFNEFSRLHAEFADMRNNLIVPLIERGNLADAGSHFFGSLDKRHQEMRSILSEMQEIEQLHASMRVSGAHHEITGRIRFFTLAGGLVSICIVLLATFMARNISRHISQRETAESALARTNRALKMVNSCSDVVMHAEDEKSLSEGICREIVNVGGFRLAWIGRVQDDELKSVFPVAFSGADEEYVMNVKIACEDENTGQGPTATCIKSGKAVVNRDTYTEPNYGAWRNSALDRGFKSSAAFPLREGARIYGALMVYAAYSDAFDEEEIKLLSEVADDISYAIWALREKSARTQAEEEARKLNLELEQRVAERTAQLEATNKELEAFSYSVSHDLRAPLRAIDGFGSALIEECLSSLDAKAKEYLKRLRNAARSMEVLIEDLLELSRVTRKEMRLESVNLTGMANRIVEELTNAEPDRAVEFVAAPGMAVTGDSHLLEIMLKNLIGNAWKFTGKRESARIEMGTVKDGDKLVYYLSDNGAGFDPKYSDKLFIPFQRLHNTKEFPGTGIGLATIQRIIRRHGGTIWAKGEVGKGATFYFTMGRAEI